jgi:hypothetical protein
MTVFPAWRIAVSSPGIILHMITLTIKLIVGKDVAIAALYI